MSDEKIPEEVIKLEDGFEPVPDSDVWKPSEEGDAITGVLVQKDTGKLGNGVYELEVEPRKFKTVYGTKILDSKLSKVKVGSKVQIVYAGEEASKDNPDNKYHKYLVGVKDGK